MAAQQETTLPAVLGDRLLIIPDYQRPYAWERKQLADLWDDLDLLGKGVHYAGTLVLRDIVEGGDVVSSEDQTGTMLRHCEVVDGQQRLTTCIILLDRIRRRLTGLADRGTEEARPIADKLQTTYGTVKVDNASVPKLRLGDEVNDYWVDVILGNSHHAGGELLGGQARLDGARQFFDQRLDDLTLGVDDRTALARLRDLQTRITSGLRFLVYEVTSAAEVGVIFETLNERGRPLTDLEKAKNYLLYLARQIPDGRQHELASFINARWATVFRNLAGLDGDTDDQLLRAHWLATQDPDARSWRRVRSLKERFDRSKYVSTTTRLAPSLSTSAATDASFDALFDDVKAYVTSLHDCSFFLAEMFDPQGAFVDFGADKAAVRERSAALYRSGVVANFRPLLLAARLSYPTDAQLYMELVDLCERYSARVFVIAQRRVNAGQAKLYSLAHDLYSQRRTPTEVKSGLVTLLWRYADDERLRSVLESTSENWYARRGHKYFLYEYELSLMKGGEELMAFDHFTKKGAEQRTTEHILPQHPSDDATCWWDHFTLERHAELRHTLGNLCLTLDNSRYSNKCFLAKRGSPMSPGAAATACYAQGSLHQERELAVYEEWTPATIADRQLQLTAWALDRWKVERPPASEVETEDLDPDIEAEGPDV